MNGPIVITGGAGYIGSHTVLAFREAGYDVVVIDDLSTGNRKLVPADVPMIVGDVADARLLRDTFAVHRPCAVIHFAGSIITEESMREPLKYYHNNTLASLRLVECCQAAGIETFLFSSTAAVYGNARTIPIPEDSPPAPESPYGTSKWMTERILADVAATSSFRYGSLRYFNVAGADPLGRSGPSSRQVTHLLRILSEAAVGKRKEVAIFGTDYDTPDGTCIRDYVHVSDLAAAHVAAFNRLAADRSNFTLNVGYGHGYSVRQVVAKFVTDENCAFAVREQGRRPGDVAVLIADNCRILEILDWRPKYDDLESIISTALAWERRL